MSDGKTTLTAGIWTDVRKDVEAERVVKQARSFASSGTDHLDKILAEGAIHSAINIEDMLNDAEDNMRRGIDAIKRARNLIWE